MDYIPQVHSVLQRLIRTSDGTPSPEQIDKYMTETLQLKSYVIGQSIQHRNLYMYELILVGSGLSSSSDSNNNNSTAMVDNDDRMIPTVLLLSLVHGNEPMGLLSLLMTATMLVDEEENERTKQQSSSKQKKNNRLRVRGNDPMPSSSSSSAVRVLFIPVVNIDAYTLNLQQQGDATQRKNLRSTKCSSFTNNNRGEGVDLNRNFPIDFNDTYGDFDTTTNNNNGADFVGTTTGNRPCSSSYHGPKPFSEPETIAIRDVVVGQMTNNKNNNVVAAMSFHSLSSIRRGKSLLIHPYTSRRPIDSMPLNHLEKFRSWGNVLINNNNNNHNHNHDYDHDQSYVVGTASETIQYTAGGTTIDWLYGTYNITAFVLETVPTCNIRWCHSTPYMYHKVYEYGTIGRRLVDLVRYNGITQEQQHYRDARGYDRSMYRAIGWLVFGFVIWSCMRKYKKVVPWMTYYWRRAVFGKTKDVAAATTTTVVKETELQYLTSTS